MRIAVRAIGILKPNTYGGFILTMQVETALRRLQALARLANEESSSETLSVSGTQTLPKA